MEFQKDIMGMVPEKGFTHGAKFHSDDVFATALLRILNPDFTVERGFDVPEHFEGIVYDIGRGAFDHHQEDREVRENGVPYAAFGLLWREFGTLILTQEEADKFDESFVQPLDESDNTGSPNDIAQMISKFNPGWDEEPDYDRRFEKIVGIAEDILRNYLEKIQGLRRANTIVKKAMEESDGKLLLLPCYVPWKELVIGSGYLFAIYPSNRGGYSIQGVPVSKEDQSLVCDFPEEWWGKEPEQLQQLSGVSTFRFCHATGFLASADTREDAVRIGQIAIRNCSDTDGE